MIEQGFTGTLRVAAAAYPVAWMDDWGCFERKLTHWVEDAAARGAQLLVFPEYFSMEVASIAGADVAASLPLQLEAMQTMHAPFTELLGQLARRCSVHVAAGSYPVLQADGTYRNRCYLIEPDGRLRWQDKLQMTRFENETWHITRGEELRVFDTAIGRIGICICYDIEFPLFARRLAEAGVGIVLVPSCTDTLAGYNRVRIGARARALENQIYVIQAPTVGSAPWSAAVDENTGAAGVYGPVDRGFAADGVVTEGRRDEPGWVLADLDLGALATVRREGQVFNFRDWEAHERIRRADD